MSLAWGRGTVGTMGKLTAQQTLIGQAQSASASSACAAVVSGQPVILRLPASLTVAVGDRLLILRRGTVYYGIAVIQAAPVVIPAPAPPPESAPSTGDPPPPTKPTVTTGTLVCTPTSTATYRGGTWRSDGDPVDGFDTYQGRYAGSSYGRMTGAAFYGSKPRSLSGATCTKATLKLKRLSGGDYSSRAVTLRLVSQSSRPGGAPTLNESTPGPGLKIGDVGTFTLPTSWGQALIDGSRGGLAIAISSDTPYIHLAGRGSWSAAWTLTISWRRTS